MTAEDIKARLSMRQVVERYGFEVNRAGYISCPFHQEHTPSLKIYDQPGRGWNCFGCGKGGSVIDFVIHYFRLNYRQALLRIGSDFGYSDEPTDLDREVQMHQEQAARRRAEQKRKDDINRLCAEHCAAWRTIKEGIPFSDEWCRAINSIDIINMRLEVLECPK